MSPITASVRRRYLTGTGHPPPTATVSAAFGWQYRSLQYQISVPIASRAAKTSVPLLTQPSSLFATDESDQAPAPNPHRSTPPPSRAPPRFPPSRLFRTPAAVHPLAPVPGRHPKTLNGSCHSLPISWSAEVCHFRTKWRLSRALNDTVFAMRRAPHRGPLTCRIRRPSDRA
jgi:hypothetical protein